MASPGNDGPDGSSIKPVSSLRARFENMSKPTSDSLTAASSPLPFSRSISPAPKPDRLRDQPPTPTASHKPPLAPKPKPGAATPTSASFAGDATAGSSSLFRNASTRLGAPPPLSPRPIPPPSLLVQPPQSPPKGRATNSISALDASSFLNPDAVAKTPLSPSSSPRRIPSRPHTPSGADKSPRLSPSQPPSPPPPRRSAELRREREHTRAPPPRSKPKIPSQHFPEIRPAPADKRSPFSSPPGSSDSSEEQPPSLPTRPARPQVQTAERHKTMPPPRTTRPTAQSVFEPPPVHHSVVSRRLDREREQQEPVGNGSMASAKPPLPTRPQMAHEPPTRSKSTHIPASSMMPPPQRLPRDANGRADKNTNSTSTPTLAPPQKRVTSNPVATSPQTYLPPPSRASHGRTMTLDRPGGGGGSSSGGKLTTDFRASSTSLVVADLPSPAASSMPPPPTPSSATGRGSSGATEPISSGRVTDNPAATFPDVTNVNRRPPYIKQGVPEINTQYACRMFDVCGQLVCTTGHFTRVWSLLDGELLMSLAHGENVKATAVAFRPGVHVDDEGTRVWIGNSNGELMEADIATQSITASKALAHGRHEVIKIHRHFNELWTLDESGTLLVWGPDEQTNVPNLAGSPHQSYRVPRGHTFSMVVGDELWHAAGKELRVFEPSLDGVAPFQVLIRAVCVEGAGEISAGTTLVGASAAASTAGGQVFFGHTDGKVSIFSRQDYTCVAVLSLGSYKICSMDSVGGACVWAGYNTGRVCVYDTEQTPWAVKKEWAAHEQPVLKLLADRSSAYRVEQLQMVSLGADSVLRVWDGALQDDWLEAQMQGREARFCDFDTIRAQVLTWNAGASTPGSLRYGADDASFMQRYLQGSGSPDILVFGFQELVDLEDKTATAKRFLKPKKKEVGSDQERMSHQYRDWRDFLVRSLDDFMAGELYHLLQTAHMVGLFTCIFVKADLRDRIRSVGNMEVKRGMGGLHGNKGAIAVRFLVDDTSVCFVNCHLAAGQTQAAHRHSDIAAILESEALPAERDVGARIDRFVGGGDGSMILDHELCVLNGDLNYRIDTMSRDAVVGAVKAGNLAKLLERDQLLVARRRNAGFRLRAFEERPITFAPTYKYDVGTDTYDSSEKKRSPAWCDRLLFRGGRAARVRQLDYRRHEIRVSDHRPVTGRFEFTVKRIDAKRRAVAWMECQQQLEDHKAQMAHEAKMFYLTHMIGYDEATSEGLIRDRQR